MKNTSHITRYTQQKNKPRVTLSSKSQTPALSSIRWRRGLGRGGAFLLVSPLLGPLPTRSSRGEDGERRPCVRAYPGWFSSGGATSIRESNDEDSGDLAGRHWGRVSGDTADPRIAIEFPGGHNRCAGQV